MAPDVERLWGTCVALARADILPPGVGGRSGNIFAVALLGQQFGMPVMNAVLSIHVIESKKSNKTTFVLAANLWAALARRAGHKVVKGEHTAESCTVYLWRKDDPDTRHEATYTIEDAERAGLLSNDNYRRNPKAMLYARAVSTVVREAAGEVAMGFVDPYEAYEITNDEQPVSPPPAADLGEAVAQREAKAKNEADGGVVDAEVVETPIAEPPPEPPPTAAQIRDLDAGPENICPTCDALLDDTGDGHEPGCSRAVDGAGEEAEVVDEVGVADDVEVELYTPTEEEIAAEQAAAEAPPAEEVVWPEVKRPPEPPQDPEPPKRRGPKGGRR